MYIDTSHITRGGKTYTRHLLRESYRANGKVLHRTIGSCPCSLRLILQPDKPGKMLSFQHVYEGVLPWSRLFCSTSSR
jgi:hypothetical protein